MVTRAAKQEAIDEPIIRTSEGLRNALFEELDKVRDGTSNPARVSSIARLTTQIINSVKMEIEFHKETRLADTPGSPNTTLQLGKLRAIARG